MKMYFSSQTGLLLFKWKIYYNFEHLLMNCGWLVVPNDKENTAWISSEKI